MCIVCIEIYIYIVLIKFHSIGFFGVLISIMFIIILIPVKYKYKY